MTTKANTTWRTFDDQSDINGQWNFPATPTFSIIDHNGIIQHKWVGKPGENSIDKALETLIQEAQGTKPPKCEAANGR